MQAKLFILIRGDIPLADQAVQAGHAVAEWCKGWQHGNKDWNNHTLVYISVKNLQHLELWQRRIEMRVIDYSYFCEPDMDNEMTAIACHTDTQIFSGLQLWGKEVSLADV